MVFNTYVYAPLPSAKEAKRSSEHKVKGFADDFTIINNNLEVHQQVLTYINNHCLDVGLTIRPDKCYSAAFNGKKMAGHPPFTMALARQRIFVSTQQHV